MNEVLAKRLLGACAIVGVTLFLANLLPSPQALPPPDDRAHRVTFDLRQPAEVKLDAGVSTAPPVESHSEAFAPAPMPAPEAVPAPVASAPAAVASVEPTPAKAATVRPAAPAAPVAKPVPPKRTAALPAKKTAVTAKSDKSHQAVSAPAEAPAPSPEKVPELDTSSQAEIAAATPAPSEPAAAVAPAPSPGEKSAASAPQASAAPHDGWYLQIGAFAFEANARKSVQKLAKDGFSPRQDTITMKAGKRFRVRCGPFSSQDEAEAQRAHAAKLGFSDARVARD